MGKKDPRVDAYIAKSAPFARPLLTHIEWITEAKGEDTRRRRLETALEWIAEGKSRNWKYERKVAGLRTPAE